MKLIWSGQPLAADIEEYLAFLASRKLLGVSATRKLSAIRSYFAFLEQRGLGVKFSDGPRGFHGEGATTFPQGSARGASWDPKLEERIGDAMGREARAHGSNMIGAPCINLLRHPAWGRAQEGYGEPAGNLTRDNIVDNITLYWLTGTGASAARWYWELGRFQAAAAAAGQAPPAVSVPVGFTTFPGEIFAAPRSWVETVYPDPAYFHEVDRGGHFAAWEEPELFSTEVRAAFRSLR